MADTKNLTVTHVPTEGGKMHTSSTSFENHPSPWLPVLPASFQFLSSVKSETVLESLCKLPLLAPYFPSFPVLFFGLWCLSMEATLRKVKMTSWCLNPMPPSDMMFSLLVFRAKISPVVTVRATKMTKAPTTQPLSENYRVVLSTASPGLFYYPATTFNKRPKESGR